MSESTARKPRMSPDAAVVALVLIGSWAVVTVVTAALQLWNAWSNYRRLVHWGNGGTFSGTALGDVGLAVITALVIFWFYSALALLAATALGVVYLARVPRSWRRAVAFGAVTIGGAIAAACLVIASQTDTSLGTPDSAGLIKVWWALLAMVVPIAVMAADWLLLGRRAWAQWRAARTAPGARATVS